MTSLKSHFKCKVCLFNCSKESNFKIHESTRKHISRLKNAEKNADLASTENETYTESIQQPKTTNVTEMHQKPDMINLTALIIEVVKTNQVLQKQQLEFQEKFFEAFQKMQPSINTQNSHNVTNKTFNMQVFLNEHCKDAMNLKDFIDSIHLSLDDLEMVGEKGFVDGISNIIVDNLQATDLFLRPIHCSDAKREVMYIKENNKWEKEGPKNENMRRFVQYIEQKNIRLLSLYIEENPDCMDPDSPLNDHYLHLTSNATSATTEHLDKVIKKIAKEVLITKNETL